MLGARFLGQGLLQLLIIVSCDVVDVVVVGESLLFLSRGNLYLFLLLLLECFLVAAALGLVGKSLVEDLIMGPREIGVDKQAVGNLHLVVDFVAASDALKVVELQLLSGTRDRVHSLNLKGLKP